MTARVSARLGVLLASVASALLVIGHADTSARSAQAAQPSNAPRRARRSVPPITRHVYAPLGAPASALDADLVLNNNSPAPTAVTPTFYRQGQAWPGTPLTLAAGEVRWVGLAELFGAPGGALPEVDGLELTYTGHWLELGAQIVLRSRTGGGSVDLFPSDDSLFPSHTAAAVWWAPAHARSVVVLGNASGSPITVTVGGSDGDREAVVIGPHGSRTLTREEQTTTRAAGGPGVHWARLEIDGPVASLRPGGFVEVDGRLAGAIRFYDPAAAKQPHLFGTNLPLAQTTPHLVLLNTSDVPVVATPRVLPLDADAASPVELGAVTLSPGQATEVDLAGLMELSYQRPDLQRVSVQVLNSGPKGSLVGALSAFDEQSGLTEELPLRDTGPIGGSTGSYPWRLDADYSSTVSITNVTDQPLRFLARITYPSGVYWIPAKDLAPGASAVFDIRALRDQHVKDRTGATLPATADHGQFRWSLIDAPPGAHLVGRVALASRLAGVTSSYSCQVCCPDGYGIGVISPGTLNVPVGGSSGAGVYEDLLDCYGGDAGWVARYATSWSIQYPSVTSVQTTGTGTMQASGLSGGTSSIDGHWDTSYYEADEFTHECYQYQTVADAPGNTDVKTPTSLRLVSESYTDPPPPYYAKKRVYQILDQDGLAMSGYGPTGLHVTESFTPSVPDGNCTIQAVQTADTYARADGTFDDSYNLGEGAPNPCTSTSTQRHYVNGHQVSTFTVTWTYNGVTIQ